MAMGLRVQLLGAGHQTCGWQCGYICLWWALSIGSKGEIPSSGDLPQALPKMQKAFPALCQSLLRGRGGESRPGRYKRTRPPEPPSSPARSMPVYSLDPNKSPSTCSALGSALASRVGHPGFDSQHVYVPPGDWTSSNLSNLSNCSPRQRSSSILAEHGHSGASPQRATRHGTRPHIYPSSPTNSNAAAITQPVLPSATPQKAPNKLAGVF